MVAACNFKASLYSAALMTRKRKNKPRSFSFITSVLYSLFVLLSFSSLHRNSALSPLIIVLIFLFQTHLSNYSMLFPLDHVWHNSYEVRPISKDFLHASWSAGKFNPHPNPLSHLLHLLQLLLFVCVFLLYHDWHWFENNSQLLGKLKFFRRCSYWMMSK